MTYVGKLGPSKVYGADAGGNIGGVTGGGGGATYPPDDANHIYIWRGDTTAGSTIPAYKGGVDLTGGANLVSIAGHCYANKASIVNTGSAIQQLTANVPGAWGPAAIECVYFLRAMTIGSIPNFTKIFSLAVGTWYTSGAAAEVLSRGDADNVRFFLAQNNAQIIPGTTQYSWGNNKNLLTLEQPHHFMIVWSNGGGYRHYIDGVDMGGGSANVLFSGATLTIQIPQSMSIADIRISNTTRGAAYARAAYTAMRGM